MAFATQWVYPVTMEGKITPIVLPPHLAMCEMWMGMWCDAYSAAASEMLHWYAMPFTAPHHHEAQSRFQMEIPEPIEETGEHDLFA